MNVNENGVQVVISEEGVLDITTAHPLRVRLNGRMLNGPAEAPAVPSQKFWQPDGTQGDSTMDLRGGAL